MSVQFVAEDSVYNFGLKELIGILWRSKLIIIACTLLFSVASVVYSLSVENTYKADVLLTSARNSDNSLGQSAAQLGQLASLAGFALPSSSLDSTATDLAILESRVFLASFIKNNNIKIPLFAGVSFNRELGKLNLDPSIYNESNKQWTREVKAPLRPEPSLMETTDKFKEILEIEHDSYSGLITLSIEFYSPVLAKEWIDALITQLNSYVRKQEVALINKNIDYLNQQAESLNNAGMKTVFYNLLEEQQKKVMLALSSDEYVFKTLDPAVVPEKKFAPKRAIICVLGTIFGFFLSIAFVLFRAYFKAS